MTKAGITDTDEADGVGRTVRQAKNGKTQVIRTRKRWSDKAEEVFLEELAATCNVTASAEKAGFSTVAIYRRRMHWPSFAAAWEQSLAQGFARLEVQLVELATDSLRVGEIAGDAPAPAMSVDQALNLLRLHRASVRGGAPQRYDARCSQTRMRCGRASCARSRRWSGRRLGRRRRWWRGRAGASG
jgi:hypothetical protein